MKKFIETKGQLRPKSSEFDNHFSRESVSLQRESVNEETRSIEGVVATELPALVVDWSRWELINEVLLMDGAELPESKQVVMLDTHSRYYLSDIKGSTRELKIVNDEKLGPVLMGRSFFAHNAVDEFQLAKDGHLTDTSIGYKVYNEFTEKLRPGEKKSINGRVFENTDPKMDLWIRTKWTLLENSLVPIGADKAAKFREMFGTSQQEENEKLDDKIINQVKSLIQESTENLENKIIIKLNEGNKKMQEEKNPEQERIFAIDKMAEKFASVPGVKEAAELYKGTMRTEKEFADFIFEKQKSEAAVSKPTVPLSDKEIKLYSPMRAIRSLVSGAKCFERELSDEFAKQSGQTPEGIFLLHNAILPKAQSGKRDLTAGTATSAAELVGTDHLGSQLIDYLYEKMVLNNITFLPNRKGNIEIPVLSASAGYGWAATETTAVAEGSPTTTSKTASPKRGGRYIDITKMLMIQSDPAAEGLFTNDLLKSLALGIQNAVLNANGASGAPTGVKSTSGIGDLGSLASMTWKQAVEFETLIDDAFGDGNGMYFVTRRSHRGVLKSRLKEDGVGTTGYICENNMINGYEARTTNLVTSGDVFFGDWTNVVVPLWDGVDLVVDPFSQATQGLVRITANQLLDIVVRYASAFSYGNSFN